MMRLKFKGNRTVKACSPNLFKEVVLLCQAVIG